MFAAATTQRLFRDATDEASPQRLEAIRELGRQAMSDDIIAYLLTLVSQSRRQPTGLAIEALKALAHSDDPRVSTGLAQLLDHESSHDLQQCLMMILGHPRHGAAVTPILEAALRDLNATGVCHWVEALLAQIGTPEAKKAWESYRAASVGPMLQGALARLKLGVIPDSAEGELADISTPEARQALVALRREMVPLLVHIVSTSDNYDRVAEAITKLKTLKILSVPGSAEALQEFLSQPARMLTKYVYRQEQVESGALENRTEQVERSSATFGQRP